LVLRSSRVVSGGAAWCVRRSPKLGSRSSTNSRQQLAGSKAAAAVCLDGFLRCLRARAAPTRAADGHRLPDAKPTAERHAPSPTLLVRRPWAAGGPVTAETSSSRTNETAICAPYKMAAATVAPFPAVGEATKHHAAALL
jgi:hypothetical protein